MSISPSPCPQCLLLPCANFTLHTCDSCAGQVSLLHSSVRLILSLISLILCFHHYLLVCISCVCSQSLSHVQLFMTLWAVSCQDSPSMHFLGRNTGAGCHFLLEGVFLTQRPNPHPLLLLHWQVGFFTTELPGKPYKTLNSVRPEGVFRTTLQALNRCL